MAAALLDTYRALDNNSPRSSVSSALRNIINALPTVWDSSSRKDAVQLLLDDIHVANGTKTKLTTTDLPQALLAVKTLGRNPDASAVIVSESNLRILMTIISNSHSKHSLESTNEALRCVANALLLQESGRDVWLSISGGEMCVTMLKRDGLTSEQVFLIARTLFLATLKRSPFVWSSVRDLRLVETLAARFDSTLAALLTGQNLAKEALVDLLKVAFNLETQYPRMVAEGDHKEVVFGELWDEALDGLVAPLIRLFHKLPTTAPAPLQPPLTHVLHALLNVPVTPQYTPRWFNISTAPSTPPDPPLSSSPPSRSSIRGAFSRFNIGGSSSSSRRSSSHSRPPSPPTTASSLSTSPIAAPPLDVVQRLYTLLDDTLAHYIAFDPDDLGVRTKCREDGVSLDELAVSIPIIIARLSKGDETAKFRFSELFLPVDLDRSVGLEKRDDLLGRCIRLMSSVHFPHLKDTIGEMLFVLCNEDSVAFSSAIGYGNAAGFLFSKGIMAPPPDSVAPDGQTVVNPITGAVPQPPQPEVEMTDEEKEREAERLFVLFDRLERSGMGVNPIRQAQQEGKFEHLD